MFLLLTRYHYWSDNITKLAQSTTLYYKACTKHVPVLLCTTKLAQRNFWHTMTTEIAAPKPDPGAKATKNIFEALFKVGKSPAPKLRKFADKLLSQP